VEPPEIGSGRGMAGSAGAGGKNTAAEPYVDAVGSASAREQLRSRRRRRARMRGHAHEFMDMNIDVDPDWAEPADGSTAMSDRGAGSLGFAGTARKKVSAAVGLTTLDDDGFGGAAALPMVPGTWNADRNGEMEAGGEHH
jgi:PPE-repeat protein